MEDKDIKELLENLGSKVSVIAEENRVCNNRDKAGKELISLLQNYISKDDWIEIYNLTEDQYIKELMIDWDHGLFPEDFTDK